MFTYEQLVTQNAYLRVSICAIYQFANWLDSRGTIGRHTRQIIRRPVAIQTVHSLLHVRPKRSHHDVTSTSNACQMGTFLAEDPHFQLLSHAEYQTSPLPLFSTAISVRCKSNLSFCVESAR